MKMESSLKVEVLESLGTMLKKVGFLQIFSDFIYFMYAQKHRLAIENVNNNQVLIA